MRFPRKGWRRRVVIYLGLYLLAVIVLVEFADHLILFPSRDPVVIPGQQRVEVSTPDGALEVWAQRSPGAIKQEPRGFVLAFIGNASRAEFEAEMTAEQWGDLPIEVWGVNYPGYGGSAGSAKLKSIAPSSLAAYDALKKHAGNRPIFISGNSIGTTASLYLAANRPVAGLVLRNPPPLRQLVLGNYGWWNLWLAAGPFALQIPHELDSLENAAKVKAPAVFILSDGDTIVPPRFQQKVVEAYGGQKRLVHLHNANHNSMMDHDAMRQLHEELKWMWPSEANQKL